MTTVAASLTPARARRIRERLLAWYDANRRDLPWRHTRDPYSIWISETMLQQTRVETVIPYYERFLARFPDVETLADADQEDVYGHWAGLGYYSRARNLHAAAKQVVTDFGGSLPGTAEALRSLPGVGRYTAGAMASWAETGPSRFKASTPALQAQILAPPVDEDLVAYGRLVQRDHGAFWADVEVAGQGDGGVIARGTVLYRILE